MWKYASPGPFLDLTRRLLPGLGALAALVLAFGLWQVFALSPEDYQQRDSVRIMYIHVPAAWLSMAIYAAMAASALGTLVWRHPLADASQKAAATLGAAFTFLCLVTGSLWGRPTWGTYWEWDARMTSVLVLFLIYLGVLALWRAIEEPGRAARLAAVLTLVGLVNIPIVKFSVEWWNTLHQGSSVLTLEGPKIHPSMLWPLLTMAAGATLLVAALQMALIRNEILRRRLRRLSIEAAQGEPAAPHGRMEPA